MTTQDALFGSDGDEATPPASTATTAPRAERLRPTTLDEVVGQRHLLGAGRPLRVAFDAGRLP